ncbi:MAG: hypothetical protein R6U92_07410, partial [Bacillota bacterium]
MPRIRFVPSLALILTLALVLGTSFTALGVVNREGPITDWDNDPSSGELEKWLEDNDESVPCELKKAKYDAGKPEGSDDNDQDPLDDGWFEDEDGDFKVKVEFSDEKDDVDEYLSVSFSDANMPVYFFTVKYGSGASGGGADTYFYPDGTRADGEITVVGQQAISHITFYYCVPDCEDCLEITKEANTEVSKVG